jgi:hypothetical protein
MLARTRSFWLPKSGNAPDEYEDAFWPESTERHAAVFRCAVADGATETSFAAQWARLLVAAYGRGQLGYRRWPRSLAALQAAWWREVATRPLPWYAEEKALLGAFSSLVGLHLSERARGERVWSALAVGDSCLFHLRDDSLCSAFPLDDAAQFSNRPHLISSKAAGDRSAIRRLSGELQSGDSFYLVTDALACTLLILAAGDGSHWQAVADVLNDGQAAFTTWITDLRTSGRLRNDDVTLLAVDVL